MCNGTCWRCRADEFRRGMPLLVEQHISVTDEDEAAFNFKKREAALDYWLVTFRTWDAWADRRNTHEIL